MASTRKAELLRQLKVKKKELKKLNAAPVQKRDYKRIETVVREKTAIVAAIRKLKPKDKGKIEISDHAIVRYMQRILGIDIDTIKAKIASEKTKAMILKMNADGEYPTEDGFTIIVRDLNVVTIKVFEN